MPNQNIDLNILNDWNKPFDNQRIAALDQVVQYMYRGNNDQVRQVSPLINHLIVFIRKLKNPFFK